MTRGRKRRNVHREPNGKPQRENVETLKAFVGAQPHRSWLPPDMRLAEKAEEPLGALNLIGAITDSEYEAVRRYAETVRRYWAIRGVRDPWTNPGPGGGADFPPEEVEARKADYNKVSICVSDAGSAAMAALNDIALYRHQLQPGKLSTFRCASRALCDFYRLPKPRN